MSKDSGYNHPDTSNQERVLNQFPAEERELISRIWERSADIHNTPVEVTKHEIEDALSAVHSRIGSTDVNAGDERSKFNVSSSWRWTAAAAVLLLIFAAGILLSPQRATAPYGEILTVNLPDGSKVELNSGSSIRYNRLFSLTNRTVLLDGEAFFSVEENKQPFMVEANGATVEVTGTEFNVRSWSGEPGAGTEVAVAEGRVQFYPLDNPAGSVTIHPGNLSRLTSAMNQPSPPEAVAVDRITGWRDQKLIFNDKSLFVIFRELERRFDTVIDMNGRIGDEKLTTYYAEPGNVETVLQDICRVKGLRYAKTANGYRVYR